MAFIGIWERNGESGLEIFILFTFYVFRSIPKRPIFMFCLFKSQGYDYISFIYCSFLEKVGNVCFFFFTGNLLENLLYCCFLFLNRAVGTPHRM